MRKERFVSIAKGKMDWYYLLNVDMIAFVNEYRYKILTSVNSNLLLEVMIPKSLNASPGDSIIRLLDTNCGLTQELLFYSLTGDGIESNEGDSVNLEEITEGIYQVDIRGYTTKDSSKELDFQDYENLQNIPDYDHSFVLIVSQDYCTLIHSYSGLYATRVDIHQRRDFLYMFSHLVTHYNTLFNTDFPTLAVKDFEVSVQVINPTGTIKSNLEGITPKSRWLRYTNRVLDTYGYRIDLNGNIQPT
jgi:hypothetical protein